MNLPCNDAQLSIMSYLDGELTEVQAAPLRKHLLECQPCRASAQDLKNTSRWFVRPQPVAVPRDFASRVARRAFQGDRGERISDVAARAARTELAPVSDAGRENGRMLRFVLTLTSVAAAVVLFVAIAVRSLSLPSGERLTADDRAPAMSLEAALDELKELNAHDAQLPTPVAQPAERGAQR